MTANDSQNSILTHQDGRVFTITLNRPAARNALNKDLLRKLHSALDEAAARSDIGAVVLTGNGPAFCAGADLKETAQSLDGQGFFQRYERANASLELHRRLPRFPKPVVAAVNGYAVAGGCGVAMSCDIVFAGKAAQFGYPEVNRGLVAAMVMVSLSRLVGRRRALDLLLSGRFVPAEEALSLGLVTAVTEDDELLERATDYARDLAEKPATALRFTKELYRQVQDIDYERALELARDVNQMLRQTGEAKRGADDFARDREEAK